MKINLLISSILLMIATTTQAAEVVGKIGYMSGALVAQRTDGTVKVLGPKAEVQAGDMLITAKDSYAQVLMNDGATMTLRPNSNLRIESFQFNKEAPQADNAVFQLLKGGFRNVTGLIGKRGNADAYKIRAASATIGIRGTDFSSRLCATKDCKDEDEANTKQAAIPQSALPQVVGRVMLVQGEMSAKEENGKVRKLVIGAPVYEGDKLMTGNNSYAVVAFRDEGRVSLQESTVFYVERFKYNKDASEENAALKLLKGGVRVVTGLIGRTNHDNYQFKVSGATIGIRGTGFDAWCNGPCASGATNPGATQDNPLDGAGVYVWAGEVLLVTPGGSFMVAIQQAAIIARETGRPVPVIAIPPAITNNNTPRPDGIPVDTDKLFGPESNAGEPGLYVTVHDGQVILTLADKSLDIGPGKTGFAGVNELVLIPTPPAFMEVDSKVNLGPGGSGSSGPTIPPGGCVIN
ncbi:MAG: FecR domain-containing protein [Nitrosomonadales bacterium]|nr:FecR domain-containing protein [Nitrosomonadales bacterium]